MLYNYYKSQTKNYNSPASYKHYYISIVYRDICIYNYTCTITLLCLIQVIIFALNFNVYIRQYTNPPANRQKVKINNNYLFSRCNISFCR